MRNYIDREAALKIAEKFHEMEGYEISYQLSQLPIADVRENIHAHMIKIDIAHMRCSKCNYEYEVYHGRVPIKFCGNCGAIMDEEVLEDG